MAESGFATFDFGEMNEILGGKGLCADFNLEEMAQIDQWVISSILNGKQNQAMEKKLQLDHGDGLNGEERPGEGRLKSLKSRQLEELEVNRQAMSTRRNTQWGLKIKVI